MKRLLTAGLMALCISGCAASHRRLAVRVPNTTEGRQCWQACEEIRQLCLLNCKKPFTGTPTRCEDYCDGKAFQCCETCPGAQTEMESY